MSKKIPLSKGQFAIVDDEDYECLMRYKWCASKTKIGYYSIRKDYTSGNQKTILMHRIIMDCPKGMIVDHINHNALDNRKENLRICTNSQNLMNQRISKNNSSKYKGVYWIKAKNKFRAGITLSGKFKHLGYFICKKKAHEAYQRAATEYFGEFAYSGE